VNATPVPHRAALRAILARIAVPHVAALRSGAPQLIVPHIVPYVILTTKSVSGYAIRMIVFAELIGAAVGVGARLAQDGNEVSFVARGAHLDAIRRHGLRVESIAGDFVVDPALATDDPAEVGPVGRIPNRWSQSALAATRWPTRLTALRKEG